MKHVREIILAVETLSITFSECVFVALFTRNTRRLRRIVLSSAACLALPYFSAFSHKCHDFFLEKVKEHKVCSDFLYKFCVESFYFQEKCSKTLQ